MSKGLMKSQWRRIYNLKCYTITEIRISFLTKIQKNPTHSASWCQCFFFSWVHLGWDAQQWRVNGPRKTHFPNLRCSTKACRQSLTPPVNGINHHSGQSADLFCTILPSIHLDSHRFSLVQNNTITAQCPRLTPQRTRLRCIVFIYFVILGSSSRLRQAATPRQSMRFPVKICLRFPPSNDLTRILAVPHFDSTLSYAMLLEE